MEHVKTVQDKSKRLIASLNLLQACAKKYKSDADRNAAVKVALAKAPKNGSHCLPKPLLDHASAMLE